MNSRMKRLLFIRSKNYMQSKGYRLPKWKLVNHWWPTRWINLKPGRLEETWVVDCAMRSKTLEVQTWKN